LIASLCAMHECWKHPGSSTSSATSAKSDT